jgi:hypothetical protein
VTPDVSELQFEVTGTTLSPIVAGSPATLKNQLWKVTVPASVLQTGINLGLLKAGDTPTGLASVSVFASNTQQGTLSPPPVGISVGPIALGGDGMALPATSTFAVPDMTWTAVGGDVAFSMALTAIEVSIGPLAVTFTCEPKPPAPAIVTAAVRGTTNIPPAPPTGTPVTPAVLATSAPTQTSEPLAVTGAEFGVPIALAVGLLDLGYLFSSAARPPRRRRVTAGER